MPYNFFINKDCEYFPCHKTEDKEDFNCLFCFCPLHSIEKCGGKYELLSNGKKDCSLCTFPHKKENYDKVIKILSK